MIHTSERDTPVYWWFSRCTFQVIFSISVRIIWCQFAVGRFSDWEAVWWWCNGFFFSCYPIIDFQLTCTALNTSTGRKINPLPPKKGRKYWYQEFFCLMWVWILFVEGNHFVNHHDPSQQKARIFKAPISRREHRERVISEAAVAFWGRSWCYKWHGGGVPSKQVIHTDSKESSHYDYIQEFCCNGVIYGHVKSSDRLLYGHLMSFDQS